MAAFRRHLHRYLIQKTKCPVPPQYFTTGVTSLRPAQYSSLSESDDGIKERFDPLNHFQKIIGLKEFTIEGLHNYLINRRNLEFKEFEKFNRNRYALLGSELSAAHFVIMCEGSVKLADDEKWHDRNSGLLPRQKIDGIDLLVEGINLSGTRVSSVALDNFVDLQYIRYINVSNCRNVDDWFLAKLQIFEDTLEFIDISGCKNVTELGLLSLHHLKRLQVIKMADMGHMKNVDVTLGHVHDYFPDLIVLGLSESEKKLHIESDESDNDSNSILNRTSNSGSQVNTTENDTRSQLKQ